MSNPILVALDAMGSDSGPKSVIDGAAIAVMRQPNIHLSIFGDKNVIDPIINEHRHLAAASNVYHTECIVPMDEKPTKALKLGRGSSSMWQAIESIKLQKASAVVSAGNTGALMAMAVLCLHTISCVTRPALTANWPTLNGNCLILDVGADVTANAKQLVEFATMGAAMASSVFGIERPKVAILNMGTETEKGTQEVKTANSLLTKYQLPFMNYIGFVEGSDIYKGPAHVIITDGFVGNVAIKIAEGTTQQILYHIHELLNDSLITRVLSRNTMKKLQKKLNISKANGAVLLGLNGTIIKSHGGANASGIASAIGLAYDMVNNTVLSRTLELLELYNAKMCELHETVNHKYR